MQHGEKHKHFTGKRRYSPTVSQPKKPEVEKQNVGQIVLPPDTPAYYYDYIKKKPKTYQHSKPRRENPRPSSQQDQTKGPTEPRGLRGGPRGRQTVWMNSNKGRNQARWQRPRSDEMLRKSRISEEGTVRGANSHCDFRKNNDTFKV